MEIHLNHFLAKSKMRRHHSHICTLNMIITDRDDGQNYINKSWVVINRNFPLKASEKRTREARQDTDTYCLHGAARSASWGRAQGWRSHWRCFPASGGTLHHRTRSEAEGYSAPSQLGGQMTGNRKHRQTKNHLHVGQHRKLQWSVSYVCVDSPKRAECPSPRGKRWYRGTLKGGSRWNRLSRRGSRREAEGSAGWNRL